LIFLDVVDLDGGGAHSLALLAAGTLRAWANDNRGQIGEVSRDRAEAVAATST
jgi:alpha-tubulin suppressor-like RCC1 family protein